MLNKIIYSGYDIEKFSFEIIKDSDGGTYSTKINNDTISFFERDPDKQEHPFDIKLDVDLTAYANEGNAEEDLAFILSASLRIAFIIRDPDINELSEEFMDQNNWFFENYVALSIKLALESLLKNTPFDGLELRWSRPKNNPNNLQPSP
ncbi:hypothetical protein [Xenorhabdus bovienii]|uniref:Uncharacterized protein n=2 Tax=Xenorhabdus bovienii TaxID=40576 RepID=A0A077PZR7_XENBV|nr:hypothetical protein [Xenorhabdus bovienii]CDH26638.1 conserved hypothetical protein [Xenorhabdus bovienii str. kraussei Becker Underwood]CDM89047.1 Putative counterpart of the neighbouring HicB protein [Xenorhabdus bovienii]